MNKEYIQKCCKYCEHYSSNHHCCYKSKRGRRIATTYPCPRSADDVLQFKVVLENCHIECYWNDYTELWSTYLRKNNEPKYTLHCQRDEPIRTEEQAREFIKSYKLLQEILKK